MIRVGRKVCGLPYRAHCDCSRILGAACFLHVQVGRVLLEHFKLIDFASLDIR